MLERIADPAGFERNGHLFIPQRKMPIPYPGRRNRILTDRDRSVGGGAIPRRLLVAVGTNTIISSVDGITWVERSTAAASNAGVAWNGAQFVSVGTSVAVTSPDGITWTRHTGIAALAFGPQRVVWNGTAFVTAGASGNTANSTDGTTWATVATDQVFTWTSIAWSGSDLCIGGVTNRVANSSNGQAWTTSTIAGTAIGMTFGGGQFVGVGPNYAGFSAAGTVWTPGTIATGQWQDVAFNGSIYVAVGFSGKAATSTDGANWTLQAGIPAGSWSTIAWNGRLFAALGSGSGECATTPDGITWTPRTIPLKTYFAATVGPVNG